MPTREEYVNAAKVTPSNRTAEQQRLVDQGSNMQEVRNADDAAKRQERIHGK